MIKLDTLDIPIIRSCNLSCGGCLTFSDSKKIKGIVRLEDSMPWLEHWAKILDPTVVTVFGGEPLLHPQFIEWCLEIRRLWPNAGLRINTNGYYLDKILDKIDTHFIEVVRPQFVVSIQTGHEPYCSMVKQNIEKVKDTILNALKITYPNKVVYWDLWLDEPEIFKSWWRIDVDGASIGIIISICEQHKLTWQAHYHGSEHSLEPFYNYNDQWHVENHTSCQAKNFVNLYRGKLYKCPTVAVLEHTLQTFNLTNHTDWVEYRENYKPLDMESTPAEIEAWFENQKNPEKICNMCGFAGPKFTAGHLNRHELKENWKFEIIPIESL